MNNTATPTNTKTLTSKAIKVGMTLIDADGFTYEVTAKYTERSDGQNYTVLEYRCTFTSETFRSSFTSNRSMAVAA